MKEPSPKKGTETKTNSTTVIYKSKTVYYRKKNLTTAIYMLRALHNVYFLSFKLTILENVIVIYDLKIQLKTCF